jgi:type I restriction enzyme M protein
MMNADTKRHIDSARQVLVGVVPNPTTQIEQITNALIYKFMDDMDQAAIKAGGDPSFFVGDLAPYAWTRIMDTKIGNQERMNLYSEALLKFSEAKKLPELFRDVFKSAFLPYRSPETLGLFLKEIDYFDYSHPEELGNAYEYLLSIMSSQGDAGQFRTPRHIIDFIVDIINPTKDDKVLDPACGTAGFLISAYNHILSQHNGKDDPQKKEKPLTPDDRKKLVHNFEGYDIDPTMVRIAQVNMYLHQFKNPKIFQYDSLSSEERWNDKFDVILANPPFMSPKGGIKPHSKFGIQSSRSEVLFVDYIMNHLRPKGRAGIIVPEGIIFQSGGAHKQLRKNMLEDGLYAVISLPSGIFNPYSGVKTSILLLDKELAKQKEEILFIKIESDGYDLGAQRRPIAKNDLPIALEIINKWNQGEKLDHKLALYIEKSKIAETDDYNLSGDRYRINTDYTNAKWPMVELGEVCDVYQPKTITSSEIKSIGKYKVFGANGVIGYYDEYNHEDSEVAVTCRGATCGTINFTEPRSWITGNAMVLKPKENNLNKVFLFYLLRSTDLSQVISGAAQPQITGASLKPFKIPLPPLEIQEQIVAELDGYSAIINGAKQITQNWKPKIDIDPEWEKVKLGDVCEITSSKRIFQEEYVSSGIPFYRTKEIVELSHRKEITLELFISEKRFEEIKAKFSVPEKGDILISAVGTIGISWVVSDERKFYFKDGNLLWLKNFKNVETEFIKLMLDITVSENLHLLTNGASYNALTIIKLKDIEIPLPPLEIQKQIVEKIEAERALVESTKKLIDIYEQKTKETIAKLWEE